MVPSDTPDSAATPSPKQTGMTPREAARLLQPGARVYFAGIGGVGMSALAELLHRRGVTVTGSDQHESEVLARLRALGITATAGHDPAELEGATCAVFTAAIRPGHPLRTAASARSLPSLHRADVLAALGDGERLLAVAGTHGKTTTSGALAEVWAACGHDPTALVGGDVLDWGRRPLRVGGGEWMVAEADESDGSFLRLSPEAILLTNAEPDHLDHHGTVAALERAFADFLARLPDKGTLVYCADDPVAARLGRALVAQGEGRRVVAYGLADEADVRMRLIAMQPGAMRFEITHGGERVEVTSVLGGAHNALNLTGAFALARAFRLDAMRVAGALGRYRGVARRQEWIGAAAGYRIFDDYAHHPTEIRATLAMFRELYAEPITAVFQPHLYSRTAQFAREFAEALRPADHVVVTEVYAAREAPIAGVSGRSILEHLRGHPSATFLEDWREFADRSAMPPGFGILLTLGAGDITGLGPLLLKGAR
jgi:UDP-N-acetylmuramate--alanine ligase